MFLTPAETLPANFVVQNLIDESLRSSDVAGLCQACCEQRKLEPATATCEDCVKTLCDSCAEDHVVNRKHGISSLIEVKCAEHHRQKLKLFCLQCQTNICVVCFSERHQSHGCDAIDTLAIKLSQQVEKVNVEQLKSIERCLRSELSVVESQKRKYERQVCVLLFVMCRLNN